MRIGASVIKLQQMRKLDFFETQCIVMYDSRHMHHFNGHFPGKPGLASCAGDSQSYPEHTHRTGQNSVPTGHSRLHPFTVAAACTWNSLPQHVTSAPSMCFLKSPQGFSLQVFIPMTFTATFVVPAQSAPTCHIRTFYVFFEVASRLFSSGVHSLAWVNNCHFRTLFVLTVILTYPNHFH